MEKKAKGLGDVISSVTQSLGIEECNNCKNKKEWLNVNFAFGKPLPLTNEQRLRIDKEPRDVYNECFGTNIAIEQFIGGVKTSILKKLKKLNEYEN